MGTAGAADAAMPSQRLTLASALSLLLCFASSSADAYTVSDEVAPGCHEMITAAALRTVRQDVPGAAPMAADANDQALIDDVQFTPDGDMTDLGGATLLLGVRDNDLKGRSVDDLSQLTLVHGDPNAQQEHCLRSPSQDEPNGSAEAVVACVGFIRGRIQEALGGLDAAGKPDPSKLTTLTVYLSIRGQVDAQLPTYYVRMGQAIHAVEDSFTHTYRTPDETQITVALNWIDKVNGSLVESRDGPAHASQLDRCDDPDAIRTKRHGLAQEAATELLRATLDTSQSQDQKMAQVDSILQKYMGYSPGCTYQNGWCNAPERQYADPAACACRAAGLHADDHAALLAAAIALAVAMARRRRGTFGRKIVATLVAAGALPIRPAAARADEAPSSSAASASPAVPPPPVAPVPEPGPPDPNAMAWGGAIKGAAAIDNPALAGGAGLRLRASKHWAFGLNAEWNPWLALTGQTFHAGSIDVFGSAMLRFPLAYENFNLRTTLGLGAAYLITNLYGAPTGSVGPYFDVSFLGLEWKWSRTFLLVVDPVDISVPAPHLAGVPFLYRQYRFTLTLEAYLG